MKRMIAVLCVAALAFSAAAAASATTYNLTALAPLSGYSYSWGFSVANVGGAPEAVGMSFTSASTPTAWINGVATSLLPYLPGAAAGPSGAYDWAHGINDNGDIVGQTHVSGVQDAFYLPHGASSGTYLPSLSAGGASSAWGVNDSGSVVGWSTAADGKIHAFVWSSTTGIVDLGTSGQTSFATAISPDGNTVIGDINVQATPGVSDQQGQLAIWTKSGSTWTLSTPIPLTTYNQSTALGINSSGDIVGSYYNYAQGAQPSTTQYGLLLPHTGGIVGLGDTGKVDCYARGINDSGVIAGSDGSFATGTAWVDYNQTAGGKTSLGTLLAAGQGTGWSLTMAESIDDAGQIAGIGKIGSAYEAYLLAPVIVPEPSALVLAAVGLAGLAACAWRKGK